MHCVGFASLGCYGYLPKTFHKTKSKNIYRCWNTNVWLQLINQPMGLLLSHIAVKKKERKMALKQDGNAAAATMLKTM